MATHSNNFIRVRLHFDYPPPAVIDCRMCWLLVDLNTCRVVADLESIIREKFEFSRGSILNLYIEDCYLPHTESIYVVRENDSVKVKVSYLAPVIGNGSFPVQASENCRKRQRPREEEGPGENGVSVERKEKKRRKRSEGKEAKQASGDERNKNSQEKCTEKKKKKKKKKAQEKAPTVTPKSTACAKNTPVKVHQPVKSNKKPPVAQNVSSSDSSSSSSEEEEAPKKTAAQKPALKTHSSTPAAPKAHKLTIPTQTKPRPPSSSSSETVSSSDEATSANPSSKNKPLTSTTPTESDNSKPQQASHVLQPTNCAQKQPASVAVPTCDKNVKSCTPSSEEEIELVIRRPVHQLAGGAGSEAWRGRGRGKNRRGGRGETRWGEGRGGIRGQNGSFEFNYNGAKEPSYQTDSLSNKSVVLQNKAESTPKQDYSSMPLLAAPPQVGQKIAFKLLELTENYTPEVSEYKEGKIVSFDHTTKQIELELQNASLSPVEPGKFDLVYQNPDGSERVEYAVSRSSRVTERWDSLLEPRLII
uniref:coilin n=1 Tax=Scatophagus argus TaxID=75038 RepID=UPI001ED80D2A|nr:coilin [Scatophagus argus]